MNDPYRACRYRGAAVDDHEYVAIEHRDVLSALRLALGIDPITTALVVTAPLRGPLRNVRRRLERAAARNPSLLGAEPAMLACVIASLLA